MQNTKPILETHVHCKAIKGSCEMTRTALDLFSMHYPRFVYGRGMVYGELPVFCFHGVELNAFKAMLEFIDLNGYATMDADDYTGILTRQVSPPRKGLVLTFDDGWGSLWSIGFPILKRYGLKIIVFIPPGRIERGGAVGPNLDDLNAGKCKPEDVFDRDKSERPLLTWEEITEMHNSGLVDFQSHSYNHGLITRSANVIDFLHPGLINGSAIMELPCPPGTRPAGARAPIHLGEPLYETAPRLSDVPQLFVDPRVAAGCVSFVEENGGLQFFDKENWRKELNRTVKGIMLKASISTAESPAEQAEAIRFELSASKKAIETMLPGKTVRHICYPWHVAGSIATKEAMAAGYTSAFWGKVDGLYFNSIPGDPFGIARVGADFFYRLPGEGRLSLLRILFSKIARRAHEGSPYLTH